MMEMMCFEQHSRSDALAPSGVKVPTLAAASLYLGGLLPVARLFFISRLGNEV